MVSWTSLYWSYKCVHYDCDPRKDCSFADPKRLLATGKVAIELVVGRPFNSAPGVCRGSRADSIPHKVRASGVSQRRTVSVFYEVKICRSCSTYQNDGILFPLRHRPGVIKLARDDDVAPSCEVVLLIAQSNKRSAGNHYDILVVCMPMEVKMRASREHRIIGPSRRDWIVPLGCGSDTDRKTVAAAGWAPIKLAHIHCERLNIRGQSNTAGKQTKQWQARFQCISLSLGERPLRVNSKG